MVKMKLLNITQLIIRTMNQIKKLHKIFFLFFILLSYSCSDNNNYVLKLGHLANEEDIWNKSSLYFKKIVEERSHGKIKIKIYPNEQLGKEIDLINGLQLGTVDMTIAGEAFQNWVPSAAMLAIPYAIRDFDHLQKIANGKIGKSIEKDLLEKINIRPISWFIRGPRHLTSNEPIMHPDDLNGIILRVPNVPLFVSFWQSLGAKPTPMAFSEVFTSLQQNTIHAQENPLSLINSAGFSEVQKFCNLTSHVTSWIYVVLSEKKLKSLPVDIQKIILKAGDDMQSYQHKLFFKDEDQLKSQLIDKGMKFIEVEKNAFIEKSKNSIFLSLNEEQKQIYNEMINVK